MRGYAATGSGSVRQSWHHAPATKIIHNINAIRSIGRGRASPGTARSGRGFGQFVRVLTLPVLVDAERVDARFENGVLLVKLAKHESAKPRKIPVKSE